MRYTMYAVNIDRCYIVINEEIIYYYVYNRSETANVFEYIAYNILHKHTR